jgi:hypothetical protein
MVVIVMATLYATLGFFFFPIIPGKVITIVCSIIWRQLQEVKTFNVYV